MSRTLHPAGWTPGCWAAFAVSVVAVAAVALLYTVGAL